MRIVSRGRENERKLSYNYESADKRGSQSAAVTELAATTSALPIAFKKRRFRLNLFSRAVRVTLLVPHWPSKRLLRTRQLCDRWRTYRSIQR